MPEVTPTLAPLVHSIEDAAERLAIGRTSFYSLLAAGKIRSIRIGGRRVIPECALVEFVDQALADVVAS